MCQTKTFCIINKAFQPYYHKQIIDYCKNHPFTVGHDSDTGVQKMNPIATSLKKFPSLKSYFLSEYFSDGRFQRLNEWLSDPLVEPPFLFTQAKISIFTNFNLLLQREEPTLHILKSSTERLATKITNRKVKPSFLKNIISVADIDITEESILLDPKTIFLRVTTKAAMNRLLNNGDITQATYDHIHKDVQLYYKDALDYIQRKFPISDPVTRNSRWVDVLQRDKAE